MKITFKLVNFRNFQYCQIQPCHLCAQTVENLHSFFNVSYKYVHSPNLCSKSNTNFFGCLENILILGEKSANFLTSWIRDLSRTRFDVSEGIRRRVIFELVFLTIFQLVFVVLFFIPKDSGYHFVQVIFSGLHVSSCFFVKSLHCNPMFEKIFQFGL